jgi:hypothetical protein
VLVEVEVATTQLLFKQVALVVLEMVLLLIQLLQLQELQTQDLVEVVVHPQIMVVMVVQA